MKKILTTLIAALPLCAFAQQGVIEQRQDAFSDIESIAKKTDTLLSQSEINWLLIADNSETLKAHSEQLATLFPQGSQSGSKAKNSVWDSPEKFQQLLSKMDEGFQTLYQASLKQDLSAAEDGLETAQGTCRACHRSYRSRW
ncbi:c-type cytochrome [Vibrio aquaticus]|uniref:c-type cytochrome n=1 Tax=Vibrio aquaticus TaxID=2496559 RepID=UPI001319D7E8|nr:cytochrome c [Vibrio aquaticus]